MSKVKKYTESEDAFFTIQEPGSEYYFKTIKQGIHVQQFLQAIIQSPFDLSEWARLLHISERTIHRYKASEKHFDPLQSERILELQQLNLRGQKILGNIGNFRNWLHTQNIALGMVSPIELLGSSFGIQLVSNELGRIEHGIYS